jgi:hypothetical protein
MGGGEESCCQKIRSSSEGYLALLFAKISFIKEAFPLKKIFVGNKWVGPLCVGMWQVRACSNGANTPGMAPGLWWDGGRGEVKGGGKATTIIMWEFEAKTRGKVFCEAWSKNQITKP